jgi:branched-chain amino acid aminotransferase
MLTSRVIMAMQAWKEGRLREVFGCGTACIIQPIHSLQRDSGVEYKIDFDVNDPSTLAARLIKQLSDIQYARVPHEWSVPFE